MKKILLAILVGVYPALAAGQAIQQSGSVTPGHVGVFITNGVMGDGGAIGGPVFTGPTTLNDFACVGATGTIIDCGLTATGINSWPAQQNFNGGATAPTRSAGDNTTNVATTAFLQQALAAQTLPSGQIWIGSAGNIAAAQTPSGDCTVSVAGVVTCTKPVLIVPTPVTATTLQATINTACSGAEAVVQIPVGNWTIDTTSASINIASCGAIIIQGSGGITSGSPNGTLLTNNAIANDLFNVTTNGSVVFRDFAITASVTKNAGTALIRLNDSTTGLSQQVIQRMSINNGCNAIEVDNSFNFIIEDNLITSFTCEGIAVTQPSVADQGNNIISHNKIWDVSGTAGADSCILWNRGSGVRIEGNRCLGAFNYGLHVKFDNVTGNDGALIATGNTFEVQKLSGIYLERTAGALAAATTIGQMVFSSNFIQSITSGGTGAINIASSGGSPWVQGAVITGNSIQDTIAPAFNAAIEIDGCDQCVVADNMLYVTGGVGAGIRVSGNSTNTKVLNNSNDGTTAATKYPALNSTTTLVDMAGMLVANLPSPGNGSMVYATDGTHANPIAGSGAGAYAVRVNGAWASLGSTSAWTTYTPTVACGTGTATTASATGRYQQFGKTVTVQMDIAITTNGTCATSVTSTLPFNVAAKTAMGGKEVAVSGFAVNGMDLTAGTGVLDIRKYDGTYPGGTGNELIVEGVFESQ